MRRKKLLFTTGCTQEVSFNVLAGRSLKDGGCFAQLLEAGTPKRIRCEDFTRRYLVVASLSADASFAVVFSNRLLERCLRFLLQLFLQILGRFANRKERSQPR